MRRGTEISPMTLAIPLFLIGGFIRSKSKKAGAIYDIIWSAGILLWGISVLNKGADIALFGQIELPPIVFIGLMASVIIGEIITLIRIIKAEPAEEMERIKEETARLEAEAVAEKLNFPERLLIVHRQGLIGSANKIVLTLNGREIARLGNGEIIQTETRFFHNTLSAAAGGVVGKSIEFESDPGQIRRIDVSVLFAKGIVLSENPNITGRRPEQGGRRVRPLKTGMVLWSITNFWCYFLGIVPLRKTLQAARHPFDDIAKLRLKSAKKWNIWMTGLLVIAVLIILLTRFT